MRAQEILPWLSQELGVSTILTSNRDTHLLLLTRSIRMFAYGSSTLILALYFSALGHSDAQIGLFMSLTLVGDVVVSLVLTFVADALGRRRVLLLGAVLMALSGATFALTSNYYTLLAAAVVGVISPSGNEIGPFRAVEESTLAHLSDPKTRSDVFAWYVVVGTLGTAGGSLACGWLVQKLQSLPGWTDESAYRTVFWMYTGIGLIKAGLTLLLSEQCEARPTPKTTATEEEESEAFLGQANGGPSNTPAAKLARPPGKKNAMSQISRKSWTILLKLCALFSVDSLASGTIPFSLIAFYMDRKFRMPQGKLGSIMSAAWFVSSIGNIFASSISKRIGLIKTMVFTHLPSAIFLALLPAPTSLAMTIVLLVARASLASMDQAPRSAFLSAVVLPDERTAVMGVVNTVKTLSQSGGPIITGVLAGKSRFWVAFLVAGSLKASYDLGMLTMFLNTKLHGQEDEGRAQPGVSLQDQRRSLDSDEEELETGQQKRVARSDIAGR
ncbi:hypothetical protein B0A49_00782 [Cryomyces minteri]|uniref:Major facilitator superfamily (MFS) profile domain-containing protein n=1 Tax=Cryomyces minteri TaxID=331657 RepID=A0A4U0XL84_9PEZI|nr:hypothetical protein B0A49_00782 [Cryomyces minteri]